MATSPRAPRKPPAARSPGKSAGKSTGKSTGKATVDPRDRVIDALMRLLWEADFGSIALADVAREAGLSLAELRGVAAGKTEILADFSRRIDQLVLEGPVAEGDSARDRLFDVIMRRLDALAAYKPALKRIARSARREPGLTAALMSITGRSQRWMFAAADVGHGGIKGAIALSGVALIYAETTRVWLKDDDPDMARTMASLDRGLARGARIMRLVDDVCRASCDAMGQRRQSTEAG